MTTANHKINKNTLVVKIFSGSLGYAADYNEAIPEEYVSKKVYDNFYIENLIPRSDYQYSWVTSSVLIDDRASMSGYATSPDWLDGNQTLSGSREAKDGTNPRTQDNLGFNLWDSTYGLSQNIYPDDGYPYPASDMFGDARLTNVFEREVVSFTWQPSVAAQSVYTDEDFNFSAQQVQTIFLYAINGPYGWPIWKQVRGGDHPVARYYKRTSNYTYTPPSRAIVDSRGVNVLEKINPNTKIKYETNVEISGKPLVHVLGQKSGVQDKEVILSPKTYEYDYVSERTFFADDELQSLFGPDPEEVEQYQYLKNKYAGNSNDPSKFLSLKYSHTVWPKFSNQNRSVVKDSKDFKFRWNSDRRLRNVTRVFDGSETPLLALNSQGLPILDPLGTLEPMTVSKWCLDGRSNYDLIDTTSSATHVADTGELNNVSNYFHNGNPSRITSSATFTWMGSTDPNPEGMFWTGPTEFSIPDQVGYTPFTDTNEQWEEQTRALGQGMSKLAEFRISENIRSYIKDYSGDFLTDLDGFLTATGSLTHPDSSVSDFYEVFTTSDIMKDFAKIREEHKDIASPTRFDIEAEAVMKFTPYEGFYPAERSVQLARLFSQSYAPGVSYTSSVVDPTAWATLGRDDSNIPDHVKWRNILTPMFAPGILYNSIKAGVAVDFPIITGSYRFADDPNDYYSVINQPASNDNDFINRKFANIHLQALGAIADQGKSYFKRVPFEALISPESALSGYSILDLHTHPSSSINITASLGPNDNIYSLAMSNYLAEIPSFFLRGGNMSSIVSSPDTDQDKFYMDLNKTYKMRFIVRGCDDYDDISIFRKALDVGILYNQESWSGIINTETGGVQDTDNYFPLTVLGMVISGSYCSKNYENYSRPYYSFEDYGPSTYGFVDFIHSYDHSYSGYGPNVGAGLQALVVSDDLGVIPLNPLGKIADNVYTPAFNSGYAYVDYEFKPYDENGNYTTSARKRRFSVDEIVSNLTSSYYRNGKLMGRYIFNNSTQIVGYTNKPNLKEFDHTQAYYITGSNVLVEMRQDMLHEMQLDSSFNLFEIVKNKSVEYDENGNIKLLKDDPSAGNRLVIYPKWEVPIFDYSNAEKTLPLSGSNNMSRGVWSDWGQDLTGSNGLFMQVIDSPSQRWTGNSSFGAGVASLEPWTISASDDLTGSLADVMGINKDPVRLGKISDGKKVYEAIVAVPFLETPAGKRFIKIPKDDFDSIVDGTAQNPSKSLLNLVDKMKKYVIPPKFDFLKYNGKNGKQLVDPIVMYFLEFEYEFDREDMKRMWHNVAPKSIVKKSTTRVGHELIPGEIMPLIANDEMKWMVFKVKQKAEWNYYSKTLSTKDDDKFKFDFTGNGIYSSPDYSYNWPYDFMSVIDRAKISATVRIETEEVANIRRNKLDVNNLVKAQEKVPRTISDIMPAPTRPKAAAASFNLSRSGANARATESTRGTDRTTGEQTEEFTTFEVLEPQILQTLPVVLEPQPIITRNPLAVKNTTTEASTTTVRQADTQESVTTAEKKIFSKANIRPRKTNK